MSGNPFGTAVVQMQPKLGDVQSNLEVIEASSRQAADGGAALVIVPELATTGYLLDERIAELAETIPGATSARLCDIARENSVYLVCGIIERQGVRFFNSSVLCAPDGELLAVYRKLHLFSSEKSWYSLGGELCVVETEIGNIGLSVCYDLIFPEYIRSLTLAGAELIVNCTNWVTNDYQTNEWGWSGEQVRSLARTRALENGVYVAMADCTGVAGEWRSLGHSCIASPSGRLLAGLGEESGVATATVDLDPAYLSGWRSIATYLPDRRPELYKGVGQSSE